MPQWRVLLVDPRTDDREYQAYVLRTAGFDVLEACDDGFHCAITHRPDAIVIDVSPRRPGAADTVRALKADPNTSPIPVVIVSSYPRDELEPTEGFVGKPCTPDRMLAEVARVLKG